MRSVAKQRFSSACHFTTPRIQVGIDGDAVEPALGLRRELGVFADCPGFRDRILQGRQVPGIVIALTVAFLAQGVERPPRAAKNKAVSIDLHAIVLDHRIVGSNGS